MTAHRKGERFHGRPWPRLAVAAVLAAVCVVAASGCVHAAPGRKVDIGGYRLRLYCTGQGSPVVVMDSGLGDTMETWADVWPGVKAFTRICVYDRAGLGKSDAGPTPRTSQRIVDELHGLLVVARVPEPYVLVGHSFGGLNVRLFASEHPAQVAGLVLVEATHEDYPKREKELRPLADRRRIETSLGLAPPAARSEYESLATSAEQIRAAGPTPDIPVVVITAAHCCETEALTRAWMELQKDLVSRSPKARQVIADKSGHYVPFDEPGLIVDALRDMVGSIRGKKKVAKTGEGAGPAGSP
jgi:pimeloyl-ACP methyl ester carboxylesterase